MRRSTLAGVLFAFLLILPGRAFAVPKTDVITLHNGDVITCEIKEMVRGKVTAKTDNMGTIYIEWDKVVHIKSSYWFLISLRSGSLIYGQMSDSKTKDHLTVRFQENVTTVALAEIVQIEPVRYSLWDRFAISAGLGFSWDKATQVYQSNATANVKYSGTIYAWGTDLSAYTSQTGEAAASRRNEVDLWLQRDLSGRYNGNAKTGVQRNDELGLRARVYGGLTGGYFLVRSNHLELKTWLGGSVNREWSTGTSDPTNNAEGDIGASFTMFYYDSPKSNISVSADFYPNFTVSDRYRFEGTISATQEIVKNLTVTLTYYEGRDTKPPDGANSDQDRSISFSIGWTK